MKRQRKQTCRIHSYLKCDIQHQTWSTNRLNVFFNEQVKLSLISGSVFDLFTTLLSCCHEYLYDGLEWRADQSENLVVLEKLLKKSCLSVNSVPQYSLPYSHTHSPYKRDNTRWLGKMRWLYLLAMPVMSAWENAIVTLEAAHCAARGMGSSDSPYTTLFWPFKQKLLLKLYSSSSYLFCVFFLQGGTSSYLE